MNLILRPITEDDAEILYQWHNDEGTRAYSFDSNQVDYSTHQSYISKMINSSDKNQFMFEINGVKVATIKDKPYNNIKELSYTVSPDHRGKKISTLLMGVYLHGKSGEFLCKIHRENIPSIRMIERCGYTIDLIDINSICHYKIVL